MVSESQVAMSGAFALCIVTMSSAAVAQSSTADRTLADQVIACAAIDANDARLACYDKLAEPLLGLGAGEESQASADFVGRGHWDSDVFTVNHPFRIVWESRAKTLTIELHGPGGDLLALIGPQIGEGSGRSDKIFDPGDYRVGVRATDGEWRVSAVEEE